MRKLLAIALLAVSAGVCATPQAVSIDDMVASACLNSPNYSACKEIVTNTAIIAYNNGIVDGECQAASKAAKSLPAEKGLVPWRNRICDAGEQLQNRLTRDFMETHKPR